MRKTVLRIHLILSLALGLFIVATCTTGSLLLLEPTVERWTHPIEREPTPGDVGVMAVQQQADSFRSGYKADRIEQPAADGFYHVHLVQTGGKASLLAYADPGTGQVFGNVSSERKEPFQTIYQLHRYFLLTDLIGRTAAAYVVGALGIGLLLILLTGIYLWWPGLRKWFLHLRIIRNRGKLAYNLSLHKTVGMISIPILLVITLTGVVNAYEKSIPGWFGFEARETIPDSAKKSKSKDQPILPLSQITDVVKHAYPESKLARIQIPQAPGQTYQVGLIEGLSPTGKSNTTLYLDASTGEILYKTDPKLPINVYNTWRKGLHFGTWGGITVTLIYFVFGMMPLVLMITGVVIWQAKARARRKRARNEASPAAAAS